MTGATMQAAAGGTWVELNPTYSVTRVSIASPVTALIRFQSDGDIQNHNNISVGQWIHPDIGATDGTGYEIRATANPDTPDSGTMGTWLPLTSANTWQETRTGLGFDTKVFDIEIRASSSGTILASTTVTLKAEVTS